MTTKQIQTQAKDLMADESKQPQELFYLSFHDESGDFLGGVYTHANGPITAIHATHELGINPGGQVAVYDAAFNPASRYLNQLLTKSELDRIAKEAIQ